MPDTSYLTELHAKDGRLTERQYDFDQFGDMLRLYGLDGHRFNHLGLSEVGAPESGFGEARLYVFGGATLEDRTRCLQAAVGSCARAARGHLELAREQRRKAAILRKAALEFGKAIEAEGEFA